MRLLWLNLLLIVIVGISLDMKFGYNAGQNHQLKMGVKRSETLLTTIYQLNNRIAKLEAFISLHGYKPDEIK